MEWDQSIKVMIEKKKNQEWTVVKILMFTRVVYLFDSTKNKLRKLVRRLLRILISCNNYNFFKYI